MVSQRYLREEQARKERLARIEAARAVGMQLGKQAARNYQAQKKMQQEHVSQRLKEMWEKEHEAEMSRLQSALEIAQAKRGTAHTDAQHLEQELACNAVKELSIVAKHRIVDAHRGRLAQQQVMIEQQRVAAESRERKERREVVKAIENRRSSKQIQKLNSLCPSESKDSSAMMTNQETARSRSLLRQLQQGVAKDRQLPNTVALMCEYDSDSAEYQQIMPRVTIHARPEPHPFLDNGARRLGTSGDAGPLTTDDGAPYTPEPHPSRRGACPTVAEARAAAINEARLQVQRDRQEWIRTQQVEAAKRAAEAMAIKKASEAAKAAEEERAAQLRQTQLKAAIEQQQLKSSRGGAGKGGDGQEDEARRSNRLHQLSTKYFEKMFVKGRGWDIHDEDVRRAINVDEDEETARKLLGLLDPDTPYFHNIFPGDMLTDGPYSGNDQSMSLMLAEAGASPHSSVHMPLGEGMSPGSTCDDFFNNNSYTTSRTSKTQTTPSPSHQNSRTDSSGSAFSLNIVPPDIRYVTHKETAAFDNFPEQNAELDKQNIMFRLVQQQLEQQMLNASMTTAATAELHPLHRCDGYSPPPLLHRPILPSIDVLLPLQDDADDLDEPIQAPPLVSTCAKSETRNHISPTNNGSHNNGSAEPAIPSLMLNCHRPNPFKLDDMPPSSAKSPAGVTPKVVMTIAPSDSGKTLDNHDLYQQIMHQQRQQTYEHREEGHEIQQLKNQEHQSQAAAHVPPKSHDVTSIGAVSAIDAHDHASSQSGSSTNRKRPESTAPRNEVVSTKIPNRQHPTQSSVGGSIPLNPNLILQSDIMNTNKSSYENLMQQYPSPLLQHARHLQHARPQTMLYPSYTPPEPYPENPSPPKEGRTIKPEAFTAAVAAAAAAVARSTETLRHTWQHFPDERSDNRNIHPPTMISRAQPPLFDSNVPPRNERRVTSDQREIKYDDRNIEHQTNSNNHNTSTNVHDMTFTVSEPSFASSASPDY